MQWISMFENGFTLPGSDVKILTLFRPLEFSIKLYILLKIIEGPMLSIITLMHFVQNVFRKPILRSS